MKKRFAALLAGAALMLGMAASAHALTLTMHSGSTTQSIVDNGTGDGDATLDQISYNGTINGIKVSYTHGVKDWNPAQGIFDIGSLVLSGTGSITMTLSDSGLALQYFAVSPNVVINQLLSESTGTAAITGNVLINGVAVPGIEATVLGTTGATTSGYATVGPTFSMDEIVTVNLGGGTVSLDDLVHVNPVPEPGTMMLLGAGFLGLAIYGKRRKNA